MILIGEILMCLCNQDMAHCKGCRVEGYTSKCMINEILREEQEAEDLEAYHIIFS